MAAQPNRPRTWALLTGAVIIALVAGAVGGLVVALVRPSGSSTSGSASATCDVSTVADRLLPSVVTIHTVSRSGAVGNGSGSVLDTQGDILTNEHVVAAGGTITVDFGTKAIQAPARIVGVDAPTDLAVLRVEADASALTPITIGNSAGLDVGQPVVAAGAPLGLSNTVTTGIVSALNRYVNVGAGDQAALLVSAIQTDASINPGNSGGPLTNCAGQQVGVNSAGAQVPSPTANGGSIGLNFAIPIDFAVSVAHQLIDSGRATHQIIGVQAVTVTATIARAAQLPQGALVETVIPGLGASRAGIRVGDVITHAGGSKVTSADQLIMATRDHSSGSQIEVTYQRNGESHTVSVAVTNA